MNEAQAFREKAEQCERLAEAAFTESARQELKDQAAECRRRAEELDRLSA